MSIILYNLKHLKKKFFVKRKSRTYYKVYINLIRVSFCVEMGKRIFRLSKLLENQLWYNNQMSRLMRCGCFGDKVGSERETRKKKKVAFATCKQANRSI